jgi:hypothetical protein
MLHRLPSALKFRRNKAYMQKVSQLFKARKGFNAN